MTCSCRFCGAHAMEVLYFDDSRSYQYYCRDCGARDTRSEHAANCSYQRLHSGRIGDYVACDDDDCEALHDPTTLKEYRVALKHWRDHAVQGGCSHAF